MINPLQEISKSEWEAETGFSVTLPEDEFDGVRMFRYRTDPVIHRISFTYRDGTAYEFRTAKTRKGNDISGMHYDWKIVQYDADAKIFLTGAGQGVISWKKDGRDFCAAVTEGAEEEKLRRIGERLRSLLVPNGKPEAPVKQEERPAPVLWVTRREGKGTVTPEEIREYRETYDLWAVPEQEILEEILRKKQLRAEAERNTQEDLKEELKAVRDSLSSFGFLPDGSRIPMDELRRKEKMITLLQGLTREERFALFDETVFHESVLGYVLMTLDDMELDPKLTDEIIDCLKETMTEVGSEEAQEYWYEETEPDEEEGPF